MKIKNIMEVIGSCKSATQVGKSKDGSRIHVVYKKANKRDDQAKKEATVSEQLGINEKHFTGRFDHVWESKAKEIILTMLVELEREDKNGKPVYRSFNLKKGELLAIKKMGD